MILYEQEMIQMKKRHFDVGTDGFYAAYWKCKSDSDCAMIAMIERFRGLSSAYICEWLHKLGVNVMQCHLEKRIMDIIIIRWSV